MELFTFIVAATGGVTGGLATWIGKLLLGRLKAKDAVRLQHIKTKQALKTEFTKLRATKIGEILGKFRNVERESTNLMLEIAKFRGTANINLYKDPDDKSPFQKIPPRFSDPPLHEHPDLDAIIAPEFKKQFLPRIHNLLNNVKALELAISDAAFWLGEKITSGLFLRCTSIEIYLTGLINNNRFQILSAADQIKSYEKYSIASILESIDVLD